MMLSKPQKKVSSQVNFFQLPSDSRYGKFPVDIRKHLIKLESGGKFLCATVKDDCSHKDFPYLNDIRGITYFKGASYDSLPYLPSNLIHLTLGMISINRLTSFPTLSLIWS